MLQKEFLRKMNITSRNNLVLYSFRCSVHIKREWNQILKPRHRRDISSYNFYTVESGPRPTTTTTTTSAPPSDPGYLARFVNFASRSVNAVGTNLVGTGALLLAAASPLIVPAFAGERLRESRARLAL